MVDIPLLTAPGKHIERFCLKRREGLGMKKDLSNGYYQVTI